MKNVFPAYSLVAQKDLEIPTILKGKFSKNSFNIFKIECLFNYLDMFVSILAKRFSNVPSVQANDLLKVGDYICTLKTITKTKFHSQQDAQFAI